MEQEQISDIPASSDKNTENSYGKFKTADELLKAYNALESEFIKRSQKLKEYEKKAEGKSFYESARDLARKYPIAEKYAEEIANEVASAETQEKTNLEEALIKVLSSKIKTPDQMAKDETVIGKVLSDENNRDYIIKGYLDQINGQNAPVVMPDGGEMPMVKPYKPSSIKEAGELAKMIIKKL